MKKLILHTLILFCICASSRVSAHAETFFQLPLIPDTMAFDHKVDYLVEHYWDFCDLKKGFSAKQRMADAFKEYIDLMPLASADKAMNSVDQFIKKVEKQPENLLFITGIAEEYMYSDTAVVMADDIYMKFPQAVARNKKINKASKMRYERQARLLENCRVGAIAPNFTYIDRNGQKRNFADDQAPVILLYIYDTDCFDCTMAKVRLHADVNTTKLIDAGEMKIVAISSTTPDGEWRETVASYPENWTVGAVEDFDEIFEIPATPTFYLLDNNHKVYAKNMDLDGLLLVTRELASRTRDPYINRLVKESKGNKEELL